MDMNGLIMIIVSTMQKSLDQHSTKDPYVSEPSPYIPAI